MYNTYSFRRFLIAKAANGKESYHMELKNLIASSETVDIYREGDKAV